VFLAQASRPRAIGKQCAVEGRCDPLLPVTVALARSAMKKLLTMVPSVLLSAIGANTPV